MTERRMRVLLANAPWRKPGRLGVRAGSRWPFTLDATSGETIPHYLPFPFFLAYATAVLEQHDVPTLLIDAIALGLSDEEFYRRVEDFSPDIVLLETSTPTINTDLRNAKEIKTRLPECRILFVGPHASIMKGKLLSDNPQVDIILLGEYDYTLYEVYRAILDRTDLAAVPGIVFRSGSDVVETGRRAVIEALDELPSPAYHHLPMYNYNDDFQVLEIPNVQMWASRGCPFKCIFCMWPQVMYGNHRYRTRSPEAVVDEMEWLLDRYGFRGFYFDDDTFNIGKDRIIRMSRLMRARRLNVPWAVMARADTFDEETLAEMAEAGLIGIKYGIESAVQSIVDTSGKALDLQNAVKVIQFTKRMGVKVHLTFTFGLPGETEESIKRTLDFAIEQKTHSVQFSITTPFPGTKYYDDLNARGMILSNNWDDYDGNHSAVMKIENVSAEALQRALDNAIRTYWKARESWI